MSNKTLKADAAATVSAPRRWLHFLYGSNKTIFVSVAIAILCFGAVGLLITVDCKDSFSPYPCKKQAEPVDISFVDKGIKPEFATTAEQHTKGLSGRPFLHDNMALVFVFDQAATYAFWMKDMNFPIDIIWLNDEKRVVTIKKHATPESYPESFYPTAPSRYVIELNAGKADELAIRVGQRILF
jgi:uncharacterized membrane protein (UPF0127 family)